MNYSRLKIGFIVTFTMAIIAIVIRAIWQIVVIPTSATMLIFIPLIVALLGTDIFIAYIIFNPDKLKALPFQVGITVALSAGLLAGVTHFVRFIISPEADPVFSKIIGSLVVLSSVGTYLLILWFIWFFRKAEKV